MNLKRLRYFVVMAEELHFGRAAERLHMAQPPLSQQIQRLESEVGALLFERSTRRVVLTDAGRHLLPDARRLLADADALTRRMSDHRSGDSGVLRLGFVDSSSFEVMPRFLRAYRSTWPMVTYELRSLSSDEQCRALVEREIDLGIGRTRTGAPEQRKALTSTAFLKEELLVAVSEDHRLANQKSTILGQLANEPLIGFDRHVSPSLFRKREGLFSRHGLSYDTIIEATEYTTVLGLVAAGEGIAIVPASVGALQLPHLRYVRLRDQDAETSLVLLSRSGDASPLVENAAAMIGQLFSSDCDDP